jgi:hypothetical protein
MTQRTQITIASSHRSGCLNSEGIFMRRSYGHAAGAGNRYARRLRPCARGSLPRPWERTSNEGPEQVHPAGADLSKRNSAQSLDH